MARKLVGKTATVARVARRNDDHYHLLGEAGRSLCGNCSAEEMAKRPHLTLGVGDLEYTANICRNCERLRREEEDRVAAAAWVEPPRRVQHG